MNSFNTAAGQIFSKKNILDRSFYARDTAVVAKDLIGKMLISGNRKVFCGGIIVETEAYYGENDPASHAYNGITPRSKIMFGRAGMAYVYFCYGNHHLLNLVTECQDVPGAVLIRAVQPIFGINIMEERRKIKDLSRLARGPGNLTKALGVDLSFNGKDITDIKNSLFVTDMVFLNPDINLKPHAYKNLKKKTLTNISEKIYEKYGTPKEIISSSRIGVKRGAELQLRYYLKGSVFVSGKHK